jgi:hypothetical protein
MTLIARLRESWERFLERLALSVIIGRLDLCPRLIPVL